jgi:hypothetical protein
MTGWLVAFGGLSDDVQERKILLRPRHYRITTLAGEEVY